MGNNIQTLYSGYGQIWLMETWAQQGNQLYFISFLKRNILPSFGGSVVDAVVAEKGSVVGRVVELEFSTRTKIEIQEAFKIQAKTDDSKNDKLK